MDQQSSTEAKLSAINASAREVRTTLKCNRKITPSTEPWMLISYAKNDALNLALGQSSTARHGGLNRYAMEQTMRYSEDIRSKLVLIKSARRAEEHCEISTSTFKALSTLWWM